MADQVESSEWSRYRKGWSRCRFERLEQMQKSAGQRWEMVEQGAGKGGAGKTGWNRQKLMWSRGRKGWGG